jgi:hypothetical protein
LWPARSAIDIPFLKTRHNQCLGTRHNQIDHFRSQRQPPDLFSTHVYSIKGSDWAGAFGNLSERVPVFAAELGGDDTNSEIDFIERLIKFLQDREIGWAAWSWFNKPLLINRYAATRYGRIIHESLTT